MTKRIIFIIFILLAALAVLFYYIQQGSRNILTDPYKAIPADASFFIESSNLSGLLNSIAENNGLFREIVNIKGMEDFVRKFNSFRTFFNRNEITAISENQTAVISFHLTNNKKLMPLLVMTVPKHIRFRHLSGLLKTLAGTRQKTIRKEINRRIELTWDNSDREVKLCFGFISGLVICSPSSELFYRAIAQKDEGNNIRNAFGLSKIITSSGKKEDKIFIIFKNLKGVADGFIRDNNSGLADKITQLAGSAEADIFISENGYLLNGYTEAADSSDILYRFKSYKASNLSTYRRLPANSVLFETIIISDKTLEEPEGVTEASGIYEFASELLPALDNEITRSVVDLRKTEEGKGNLIIYSLKNRDLAERIVTERLSTWNKSSSMPGGDLIKYFQPDDQIKIPVFSTPFKGLASLFLGNSMISVSDSLLAFNENYMICADRYEAIERFLYDNMLNKTISTDIDFREFESTLPSKAGYFFYCRPSAVIDFLEQYLNDTIVLRLKENKDLLKKIDCIGYQFVPSNQMIYNTLSVRYKENIEDEAGTEWETKLDGAVVTKPFFFTNHNTGAREIIVQDDRNNLYLINAAGRILWKIPIGEKINGDIYMIDFYGNRKYQILFAGTENLYLLDRNGNYVERYPVKLRAHASGPAVLFDYDNNRNYRIFIPGEDKLIYAYDKYGNIVKGWKPFRTNGTVRSEMKFFRVSGKDFIIAADENTVYFLDRTGNVRLKTSEPVSCAKGSEIRLNQGAENSLVFSAPDGTVQFVNFDGSVKKSILNKFSFDHSFDFFDTDGDGYGEFIFIDRGKLYLYDHDNTEIFMRDFGTESITGPLNFIFSSVDRKIGVYDSFRKQIFIIDKRGNDMTGFPLKGFSEFSIGRMSDRGSFHLIVGGNNNFLYNYKLNIGGNN